MKSLVVFLLWLAPVAVWALDLNLPTANQALLKPGGDVEYFQPTVEGTTESGMFGCVRRDGFKFHEGIDIKCLQRDRRGEPTDPVYAVSDGEVAFINVKPGLSNYGRYVVLAHRWDGVEVFTLYAHLREVAAGLVVGQPVRKGQVLATLGHSTNTREGIPAERAHLHFEINFMINTGFRVWFPKREPKAPPFGNFNGKNLMGLDPAALFRAYAGKRPLRFSDYIAQQPIAFTVLVNARPLSWLALHPEQVHGVTNTPVVYEIASTSWGLPLAVWTRGGAEVAESELRALRSNVAVVHRINEAVLQREACVHLVTRSARGWRLSSDGVEWAENLTFRP